MRIIFMGTPEFAVSTLEALYKSSQEPNSQIELVGVITAPDKAAGRGKKMKQSDVKIFAQEHGLTIMQPTNLKSPKFVEELRTLQADLQIVVAFRMLPEVVWNMPTLGTFNLHASLLPKYRGAAPINWAIINGEKETGVTTFFLQHEIDTGNVIFQEKEPIHEDDNVGTLYQRLMALGAQLVLKTVKAIQNEEVKPTQQKGDVIHAPKIFKETCQIDWQQQSCTQVNDFVRGLSPYPAAWTILNGKTCKIYEVDPTFKPSERNNCEIGDFITDQKTYLAYRAKDGFVSILNLKLQGKRQMPIEDFLRGFRF